MPAVSVLVVNYNAGSLLGMCLTGLRAQTFGDFEVIIVDNASTDGSLASAAGKVSDDPRFMIRKVDTNLGFASGNNFAAKLARGAWLALLNPDAEPELDWLDQLMAATERYPDVVMFGSTQIDGADAERLDGTGDHYLAIGLPWRGGHGWPRTAVPSEREVFSPCAAAALIRADAFREVGGFDERFFCYVEDVELAFRLRLNGGRCVQVPAAIVKHFGGSSSGGKGSAFSREYGTRNLIWCYAKCMPSVLFWPLLPIHLLAMAYLLVRATLRGVPQPIWKGIGAAVSGLPSIWQTRKTLQRNRRITWWKIASALTWNPVAYLRRAP